MSPKNAAPHGNLDEGRTGAAPIMSPAVTPKATSGGSASTMEEFRFGASGMEAGSPNAATPTPTLSQLSGSSQGRLSERELETGSASLGLSRDDTPEAVKARSINADELSDKKRIFFVLAVNIIGGLLVGYAIGYVPVALFFQGTLSNCTTYTTESACHSQDRLCQWVSSPAVTDAAYCAFRNQPTLNGLSVPCSVAMGDKAKCKQMPDRKCVWLAHSSGCAQTPEWASWQKGLYAGMMIIGAMVGSLAGSVLLKRLGRKKVIFLTGVIGVVAGVLYIVGWSVNEEGKLANYAVMVLGRLFAGIAVGIACVACPMYCGEMAPSQYASIAGCMFQVAVTFGCCFAALIGFIVDATSSTSKDINQQGRFHIVNAVNLIFPVLLTVVAAVIPEPSKASTMGTEVNGDQKKGLHIGDDIPLSALKTNFVVAIALAAAQQLTGINAVMNYAPDITKNFGLPDLRGNLLVMAWNFVTTLASLKFATMFSTGRMYLVSATVASLACLLTAIPIFPTVFGPGDNTGYGITGAGVFIFVAAFEMGMGPAFYVLAQSIFPASRRSFGCSFTVAVQFVFNLIINFCFPVAVEGISGGPDEDQRRGTAWVFVFFGVIGLLSTVVLFISVRKQRAMQEETDGVRDAGASPRSNTQDPS
jgi:MFS family permease